MNVLLDQKDNPSCFVHAMWNVFERQGHKITQKEVEKYYQNYLRNTDRDASSITALCGYTRKYPIQGYRARFKIVYSPQKPFDKKKVIKAVENGAILSLKMQDGIKLPVVNGKLVNLEKGFTGFHHAVCGYAYDKFIDGIQIENSWKSKQLFSCDFKTLEELCTHIYEITFE